MPGLVEQPCWRHYSGYLAVPGGKQLFYWYHEATERAAERPWVLWLNGGPGCSSLGGMFTELGPFVVGESSSVTLNPFSWNRVANVLFLEQPAGVGFSYPNGPADDHTTALDTVHALQEFVALHPELEQRPFYVLGESCNGPRTNPAPCRSLPLRCALMVPTLLLCSPDGGHYVPNTVRAVQDANLGQKGTPSINLMGFAVGNGYTECAHSPHPQARARMLAALVPTFAWFDLAAQLAAGLQRQRAQWSVARADVAVAVG